MSYAKIYSTRILYNVISVGLSNWVRLVQSMPGTVYYLSVFDSGGQTMELGIGDPGSEQRILLIPPGGAEFEITIPYGSSISIRAVGAAPTTGENTINFSY